jgi:hypothetical protein
LNLISEKPKDLPIFVYKPLFLIYVEKLSALGDFFLLLLVAGIKG